MAITQRDLVLVRSELEAKLTTVTVDSMKAATAIGAYGERFTGIDAQLAAIDGRFAAVDAQFVAVHARLDALEHRVDALSADMDRRFAEVERRFKEMDRRFEHVEKRLDVIESKLDSRFGWQTFMMAVLGILILFGDTIRPLIGLG